LSLPIAAQVVEVLVREGQSVRKGQPLVRFWDQDVANAVRAAAARYAEAVAALREAERTYEQARQETHARIQRAEALLKEAEAYQQLTERGARPEEIEQATQETEAARAQLELARQNWQRAQQLYAQGAIARVDYDRAEQEYRVAEARYRAAEANLQKIRQGARAEERAAAHARVDSARAELALARSLEGNLRVLQERLYRARTALREAAAAWRQAQSMQALRTLEAPRDARVNRCEVEPGESVAPGVPILELVDTRSLWGEAELAQEDAGKVRVGDPVRISAPALPGRAWQGRIKSVLPAFERKPDSVLRVRILRITIEMIQPPAELRPGMEITVEGTGRLGTTTLLVPSDAVQEEPDRTWVWVVQQGIVRQRPIKTGYFTYNYTEVVSGLREGEQVVVAGKTDLSDGQRVRIRQQR
ncbi:MAG: efflux RND transporter periplasmic adaptor subunit, partial [Fimbriimonadales bacterium]|nr:efflux RND transporter periplasmic adaptor subunit [Fimbriimonadales bacterium]